MGPDEDEPDISDGGIRTEHGLITVSEEVVSTVAASSASKIEGLGEKESKLTEDISRIFGSRRRGIDLELEQNEVEVVLKIAVKHGYPVHVVARKAQDQIAKAIEEKTGLVVNSVNIFVQKLQESKEGKIKKKENEKGTSQ